MKLALLVAAKAAELRPLSRRPALLFMKMLKLDPGAQDFYSSYSLLYEAYGGETAFGVVDGAIPLTMYTPA